MTYNLFLNWNFLKSHLIELFVLCCKQNFTCDAPEVWELKLQDPSSSIMEGILMFNKHLLFIIILVGWLLIYTIYSFENLNSSLIRISSFLIAPPKSLGKVSMFSWFVNHYDQSIFFACYVLTGGVMLVIALLGFLFIYNKKDTFFVNEFLPHFKKLSPIRKLTLGIFTVFTAIPNKFWINVKINIIFVFIISVIIYILGLIFPFLFFCYIIYLILCLESLIFGLLYNYSKYFRKSINYLLFGNSDEPFAKDYFYWFWGNTWQNGLKIFGVAASAVTAVETKRQQENQEKIAYADLHTERAIKVKNDFKNPTEIAEFHKNRRDEWVQENGIITKIIKKIEDFFG